MKGHENRDKKLSVYGSLRLRWGSVKYVIEWVCSLSSPLNITKNLNWCYSDPPNFDPGSLSLFLIPPPPSLFCLRGEDPPLYVYYWFGL